VEKPKKLSSNAINSIGVRESIRRSGSTFGRFNDEDDLQQVIMDPNKVEIIVDQLIEPFDIIWTNVGGDRGLFVCRRIIFLTFGILVLIFLTTPTVYLFTYNLNRLYSRH